MEVTVMAWVVPGRKQHDVYTPFPCSTADRGWLVYAVGTSSVRKRRELVGSFFTIYGS